MPDRAAATPTGRVVLRGKVLRQAKSLVNQGHFESLEQAVARGIELAAQQGELKRSRARELRALVDVGLKEMKEGKGSPADEVFDRVLKRVRAKTRKSA